MRDIEQPIIVIRGKIKPPFEFKPETVLKISNTTPPTNPEAIQKGTFSRLIWALEQYLEHERRVISEIAPPNYHDQISWQLSSRKQAANAPLGKDRRINNCRAV